MPRVRGGPKTHRRHNKVLKQARGYRGGRGTLYRSAQEAVDRALCYAYRDRRARKGDFRRLWIARVNAAARSHGVSYSRLMAGLKAAGVGINRKMLSEMAIYHPEDFKNVVALAKERG
jgi:large subunit ribosomal protein L20